LIGTSTFMADTGMAAIGMIRAGVGVLSPPVLRPALQLLP